VKAFPLFRSTFRPQKPKIPLPGNPSISSNKKKSAASAANVGKYTPSKTSSIHLIQPSICHGINIKGSRHFVARHTSLRAEGRRVFVVASEL